MNHARGVFVLVVLLAFAAVGCATSADPTGRVTADATDAVERGATPVDSCGTITVPGRYVLAADVENRTADTCIRVAASDVVLDGRGHAVDGGAFRENTTGVVVTGENVTVRNLAVVRWTFGIRYEGAGGVVSNVATWKTADGVTVRNSPGVTVASVRATNGFVGVSLVESDGATVVDSVANDQHSTGLFVADSRGVAVRNVTAARDGTGVAIVGGREVVLADDRVTESRDIGVLLADTVGDSVVNATFSNPPATDDVLLVNATDNRIIGTNGDGWILNSTGDSRRNHVINRSAAG